MSNTTFKNQFTDTVLAILEETFEDAQGLYLDTGASLFQTLAAISAEEASRPVSATCASLAAQVEHVRFLLQYTLDAAAGRDLNALDWTEIWRTVEEVTPEEWEASKQRLRDTHQQVLALVKSYETWESDGAMAGAIIMLVHAAYHVGEIRQALCTLKS
jgi:hypothetical protein